MIEVRDLSVRRRRHWALVDVSFAVGPGRILGVLGLNGSGKSTLLKVLAGVTRRTRGQVSIAGEDVGLASRARAAFVPEVDPLYGEMSVAELLGFLSGFYPTWSADKASQLLGQVGVRADAPIESLSDGHKARLKLIAAFAWRPKVVLLDEPFKGIDQPSRGKIRELISSEFRSEEQTILVATHLLDEIEPLLDEVVVLHRGRLLLSGEADALRAEHSQSLAEIVERVTQ